MACVPALPLEALDRDRPGLHGGSFGSQRIFRRRRFQLLELELQLIEMAGALGGLTEPVALVLGDRQLEMGDHRLRARHPGLGQLARRALGRERRLQRFDVVGIRRHATNGIIPELDPRQLNRRADIARSDAYPAVCGRQVARGFRQSIPSSI